MGYSIAKSDGISQGLAKFGIMANVIAVIIAGGSGTRLWPLSTPSYPKHLLRVNNTEHSLLQQTYNRAKRLADTVYVVSEGSHIEHVREQLSELPADHFIVEPGRRGTANCIASALSFIGKRHEADEPIAFLAADHHVRDIEGFVVSFAIASKVAQSEKRMVLVGIEPDYPATGFGYIQKGEALGEATPVFNVHSFKEKPTHDVAQEYLKSGNYLWNCSYFVGSLQTFVDSMQKHSPELFASYQKLTQAPSEQFDEVYLGLESISIDYALIEKMDDLLVIPASFDWMDIGSFNDYAKALQEDEKGNHIVGTAIQTEDLEQSLVLNEEDKPVAVIGLDNVVVVNTPHGILVARKDASQKVGEVSKRFAAK